MDRHVGLGAMAVGLLVVGVNWAPFWAVSVGGLSGPGIELRTLVMRAGSDAPLGSLVAYGAAHAAAAAFVISALLQHLGDDERAVRPAGWLGVAAAVTVFVSATTSLDDQVSSIVQPAWGVLMSTAGGGVLAWIGLHRRAPVVATPARRLAPARVVAPRRPGATSPPAPVGTAEQVRRAGRPGDYGRAVAEANRVPPPQRRRRGRLQQNAVAPAAVDAARETLRFVARECTITDEGIEVVSERGGVTRMGYGDVAQLVARRLPPDPPFEKRLFVDVVPLIGEPVRLLQSTRTNYDALPGGAGHSSTENLRALGRHLRERNPLVDWRESVEFFEEGRRAQVIASARQLAEYDARYG